MTEVKPKPQLSNAEREKQFQQRTGVLLTCRNLHMVCLGTMKRPKKRVLSDIAFLQESLSNWNDDGSEFGKCTKALVVAALAEAAKCEALK